MVSGRNDSLLILDQCYTFAMWLYFNAQDKLKAGAAVQQLFDTQRKGVQIQSSVFTQVPTASTTTLRT